MGKSGAHGLYYYLLNPMPRKPGVGARSPAPACLKMPVSGHQWPGCRVWAPGVLLGLCPPGGQTERQPCSAASGLPHLPCGPPVWGDPGLLPRPHEPFPPAQHFGWAQKQLPLCSYHMLSIPGSLGTEPALAGGAGREGPLETSEYPPHKFSPWPESGTTLRVHFHKH